MAKLILHRGGVEVTREQLGEVATPDATRTWTPIAHNVLLGEVTTSLQRAGWEVKHEQHGLSNEGNRYFGLMDVIVPGWTRSPTTG